MKNKLIFSIIIGFTALILTMVMFTQFKTVTYTDITAIETMRESELRTELANTKQKYEEVESKLQEVESKIAEHKAKINSNVDAATILIDEVKEAEMYVGYTNLKGEGIQIILDDNNLRTIESYDIIVLLNELRLAGAEAIEINGQRITAYSEIVDVNGNILVNTSKISSPYTVKAIGDKKYLESAITIKGGYYDDMIANDKTISYETSNRIEIQKYNKELKLKNSKISE